MKTLKYVLTQYETVRRVEKVEYEIEIPKAVKNKKAYAVEKISENDYINHRVVDIPNSEVLDEEIVSLKIRS